MAVCLHAFFFILEVFNSSILGIFAISFLSFFHSSFNLAVLYSGIDILRVCADFWFFEFFWLNVWIKIVSFVLMVNVILKKKKKLLMLFVGRDEFYWFFLSVS